MWHGDKTKKQISISPHLVNNFFFLICDELNEDISIFIVFVKCHITYFAAYSCML